GPAAFLSAVERDLHSNDPQLVRLLGEEGDLIFGGNYHTGLLWSLEGLAWSPAYLTRVCKILADLAQRDPGGKRGNRPSGSLAQILSPWYPQTAASTADRVRVLDVLLEQYPTAAWHLLRDLLPQTVGIALPTHRPYWRDWTGAWRPGATVADC